MPPCYKMHDYLRLHASAHKLKVAVHMIGQAACCAQTTWRTRQKSSKLKTTQGLQAGVTHVHAMHLPEHLADNGTLSIAAHAGAKEQAPYSTEILT